MFNRALFIHDLCELADQDIPFLHQGCDPRTGVDCINLPRLAYEKQARLPEELEREFDAYHVRPDGVRLLRVMRSWFTEILPQDAQPGDMLIFFARKNPQHLATLVAENEIVEAYRSDDGHIHRVLRQPLDPRRRIAAAFRIPDVIPV